jgi:hypothetical protein
VHQKCVHDSLCETLLKEQQHGEQRQTVKAAVKAVTTSRSAAGNDAGIKVIAASQGIGEQECELTQRRVCNAQFCEGEGGAVEGSGDKGAGSNYLHFGSDCVVSSWGEW